MTTVDGTPPNMEPFATFHISEEERSSAAATTTTSGSDASIHQIELPQMNGHVHTPADDGLRQRNQTRNNLSLNAPPGSSTGGGGVGLPLTRMLRGRSYSSHSDRPIGDPTPEACFAQDYLQTPLLHESEVTSAAKHLFGTPPPKLNLSWNNIDLFVPAPTPTNPAGKRKILSNVSGRAYAGETIAVMGPSGSGKTSLLSILAGGWRKAKDAGNLNGTIDVNGRPIEKRMKRWMALIEQDDVMFANLTVQQTLKYSALLNLPKELTRQQKLDRVEQTINILGLEKCRSTKIGGGFVRGISGGERKRTSIATEMLSNPSIILADEPTSGLDSTTAARLINTLRSLARGGRTVLCSIHQPSSQIFDLFDKVLLLAQGRMVYYGSTSTVIDYFGSVGLMCKPHFNPADFFLEVVADLTPDMITQEEEKEKEGKSNGVNGHASVIPEVTKPKSDTVSVPIFGETAPEASFEHEGESNRMIRRLPIIFGKINNDLLKLEDSYRLGQIREAEQEAVATSLLSTSEDVLESDIKERWPLTWSEQFVLLIERSFVQHKEELITKIYAVQVIAICLVASLVWFQTSDNVDFLTDRVGCMFFGVMFWSFTPLFNALTSFPAERRVILKERGHGSYRLSAYFLAKMVSEAPIELMWAVIWTTIWYWMVGLQPHAYSFFSFLFTILLSALTAQSFGLCISCTIMDFKDSIVFASVSMLTLMLLSGFYVKIKNIPIWLRWANYLCFPKYTYAIVGYIQFHDFDFPCGTSNTQPSGVVFSSCPVHGTEIMSAYDFDILPLWTNIVILVGIAIMFRVVAYFSLRKTTQP